MANVNCLLVEKGKECKVIVYDAKGTAYDISDCFREITGTTSHSAISNLITCQKGNSTMDLDFIATSKEMKFGLSEEALAQLIALVA